MLLGRLEQAGCAQGWAHGRRVQAAGSVLANVALHKGHLYCVADLYIIQCSEVFQSSGAGHSSRDAACVGDSFVLAHTVKCSCDSAAGGCLARPGFSISDRLELISYWGFALMAWTLNSECKCK